MRPSDSFGRPKQRRDTRKTLSLSLMHELTAQLWLRRWRLQFAKPSRQTLSAPDCIPTRDAQQGLTTISHAQSRHKANIISTDKAGRQIRNPGAARRHPAVRFYSPSLCLALLCIIKPGGKCCSDRGSVVSPSLYEWLVDADGATRRVCHRCRVMGFRPLRHRER